MPADAACMRDSVGKQVNWLTFSALVHSTEGTGYWVRKRTNDMRHQVYTVTSTQKTKNPKP